jgi:hypothetical protein
MNAYELPEVYRLLAEWMIARTREMPQLDHATSIRFDGDHGCGAWFVSLTSAHGRHNEPGYMWIYGQSFAPSPLMALHNALEEWTFTRAERQRSA